MYVGKKYEIKGVWYTIAELSEISGIAAHTIRDRIRRGYSIDEAIKVSAIQDSVKEFCSASSWEDWIGMSIDDLFNIYWRWSVQHGHSPIQKQGFSRQILGIYPMLKTVPTKRGDKAYRIIRLKDLRG